MIVQVQPYTHAYKHICTQKLPQNAALIGLIDLCVTGLKVVVISELPVGVLCYTELWSDTCGWLEEVITREDIVNT